MEKPNQCNNPPKSVKIYDLSLIWKEAAYNFAFWEKLAPTLDWDKAYEDALPAVLKNQNLYEYYLELKKFVALLRDGHTYVNLPSCVLDNPMHTSRLPIFMCYSNGQWVVNDVKRCAGEQVKRWSIVRKINDIPTQDYFAQNIFPYVWHEKLDSASGRIYGHFSNGALDSRVKFDFEHDGTAYSATLARTFGDQDWLYDTPQAPPQKYVYQSDSHKIAMTDDEIAVITIDSFGNDNLPREFNANFPLLEKARGYIIDIRGNGGGNSGNTDAITAAFIDGEFSSGRSLLPIHIGYYKAIAPYFDYGDKTYEQVVAEHGSSQFIEGVYKLPRRIYYQEYVDLRQSASYNCPGVLKAPLVVLTTAKTGSAAEDMAVAMRHTNRGSVVGTPTNGSNGQPLHVQLKSGGSVCICTHYCTMPDGEEYINIGVKPHIHFEPSLEDLKNGRDTHMEQGLEVLRGMICDS